MAASAQAPDDTEEMIFVISDSDGELDNQGCSNTSKTDYRSPFDEFVACSNEILKKIRDEATAGKIKKHLLKVFKAARQDYISSEEFSNTVCQNLTELGKPDIKDQTIFSLVHDVVIHLKNAASKYKKTKGTEAKSETEKNRDKTVSNGGTKTHTVDVKKEVASDSPERFSPCGSKGVTDVTHTEAVKKELTIDSEDVSDVTQTRDEKQAAGSKRCDGEKPSGSKDGSKCCDGEKPSGSKDKSGAKEEDGVDKEEDGVDKAQKLKIRRMEKLMGRLNKEIQRYSEKELSLEEMERDDSSHMIEHKLRTRFVEAWRKWCKLKGYEAKTGRGTEKKVKFEGTRYPEINLKIRKLVKHNKFPDFHDVYEVITKTNQVKNLGIHKFDLRPLATEVFKDIGEKLSKRRINDDLYNAGYASLIDTPDDPANENQELRTRLEENDIKGREMMDKVLEKYTHMARELHAPGVEPDFDRTSEPEIDGSEDDMEEGDWIEYVSDSDESQSVEPSVAKSPETEATKMDTCPDRNKTNGNKREDSKKHPLEEGSLSDDSICVKKKIKLEHSSNNSQETGKTFVAVNGMSQGDTEVKSTNESQTTAILHPSQGIVKVESIEPGISVKPSSVSNQLPSKCNLTQYAAGLPKKKSLSDDLSTRNLQQTQHQQKHIPTAKGLPYSIRMISKKELGDAMANLEPLQVVKGGIKLLHGKPSNVGPSSTGSLPMKTVSHRITQLNSLPSMNNKVPSHRTQLNSPSLTKVPSRRIELNSLPSTSSVASTMNKPPSATCRMQLSKQASTLNVGSTMSKPPSARMQLSNPASTLNVGSTMSKPPSNKIQLSKQASTISVASTNNKPPTKLGIPPVQVSSNRTQINGKVVKVTQIFIPNQRNNATRARQDVVRKKNLTQKTQSKQSNGAQKSCDEDDDEVIVID